MTDQNNPAAVAPSNEALELLIEQFANSMTALQMQDLAALEQALKKATNLYQQLSFEPSGSAVLLYKMIVQLIEIPTRLVRSSYYSLEERLAKSVDELQAAKQICAGVNAAMNPLTQSLMQEGPLLPYSDLFRYLFFYYDCVVNTNLAITQGMLMKSNGNYVDEVRLYREAAQELRKTNALNFKLSDVKNYDVILPLVNLLNHLADTHEKKAERIEERRQHIDFLPPAGNQVFIVHGHNEALIRELNDLLEEWGVKPVILKNEADDGNTVIEKFEHYGRLCAFAFVLVTPDDWVENKKMKYFQARPNVLFELGWFCGRYGRDKVRILQQKGTPLPSDLNGLVTIEFVENLEEVFRKIESVLQAANVLPSPKAG